MKTRLCSMLTVGLLCFGIGVTFAADPDSSDPMAGKEVRPTTKEHVKKDTITGILMRKAGEYFFIDGIDGGIERIHVDNTTKLDNVEAGDVVKAYVTEQDHTITLQRVN
ncbi:MAG: hypothetical protein H8K03_18885 [Nitrospira sp.]